MEMNPGKTYDVRALFVGIDRYKDTRLNPLRFASHDAEEMAAMAACAEPFRLGRHCYTYTNERAMRSTVLEAMKHVFPTNLPFDSQTLALFFFSGHGLKDPHSEKIYLACSNVDMADPAYGGISLNELHDYLHNSSAGYSIIICDACFVGGLTDPTKFEYLTPAELALRSLNVLYGKDDKNGGIFMSCRSNQKSHEDENKQHGIYTYEILRGWRDGEARNANGVVTLTSLRGYLEDSFANYREQTPKANLFGSKPIELWRSEPRVSGTPTQHEPLPKPRALMDVGGRSEIYMASAHMQSPISRQSRKDMRGRFKSLGQFIKSRPIPIVLIVLSLLACVLSPIIVTPLRSVLFGTIFVLGLIFSLGGFLFGRVFGVFLAIIQLSLLAGFTYKYFHWGSSMQLLSTPLGFVAGLEWIFWLLFACEMLIVVLLTLNAMML